MSELAQQVVDGDRRALARAITLAESTRGDHRAEAEALLAEVLPDVGGAVRVGISGAPGAGKSTFIEALGTHLVSNDHRVAARARRSCCARPPASTSCWSRRSAWASPR